MTTEAMNGTYFAHPQQKSGIFQPENKLQFISSAVQILKISHRITGCAVAQAMC